MNIVARLASQASARKAALSVSDFLEIASILEISAKPINDKNLHKDKRVSLSIVDPINPYRYLEVRGKVVEFIEDPDKAFIDSMAKKYLGQDAYPWGQPGEERVVVVIEPERALTMG